MTDPEYTKFTSKLVAPAIYDIDDTYVLSYEDPDDQETYRPVIEANIATTFADATKADRVVTKKDMTWILQTVEDEQVLTAKRNMEATDDTDHNKAITIEDINMTYTVFSAHERGCFDIACVVYDKIAALNKTDRWIVCSRSSGVWLLTFTNERPLLRHVENSPCCCCVAFDLLDSSTCYVFGADMFCFDSYTFDTSNTAKVVITSTKDMANNGTSTDYVLTQTVEISTSTFDSTASIDFRVLNDSSALISTTFNNKSLTRDSRTGWVSGFGDSTSHFTMIYTGSSTNVILTYAFPLTFDVSASDSPTGSALSKTTIENTVKITDGTNTYQIALSNASSGSTLGTRWGAVYYSTSLTLSTSTFVNCWNNYDSTTSSGTQVYSDCPSISKIVISRSSVSNGDTKLLFYLFNNIYNDYVQSLDMIGQKVENGNAIFEHAANMIIPTYLTTEYSGSAITYGSGDSATDVMVLKTNVGVMTLSTPGAGGTWTSAITSPTITYHMSSRSFTDIASITVNGVDYDYAFDTRNKVMFGLYKFTSATWYSTSSWNSSYTQCTFKDFNKRTLNTVGAIGFVVPGVKLVFAVSCGTYGDQGVWCSNPASATESNVFYKLYDFKQKACVSAHAYNGSLVLFLNTSSGNDCVIIRNVVGAETVEECLNPTVQTLSYATTLAYGLNDECVDYYYSTFLSHNGNRVMFAIDNKEQILVPSLEEHVVSFNANITNTLNYDDLDLKIQTLLNATI